jgi:hypothetical protein
LCRKSVIRHTQVTDAFPWAEAPRLLLRDRDGAFGPAYTHRVRAMGILRSSDRAALRVAERPRRAPHRHDPVRKPRSLGRLRRSAVASRSEELRFLLQSGSDTSLMGQECAGFSAPAEARLHRSHLNSGWATSSICQGLATVLKVEEARCPQGPQALGSNEASRLWTCGQRAVCLIFIECNRAWLPPGSIGLEHGVEDHDDPAHHCHQRDFFELAACKQPFIKLLEQRIKADRTQRAHVKLAADRIASAPDDPAARAGRRCHRGTERFRPGRRRLCR